MYRETFFNIMFYIFDKWKKKSLERNIKQVLMKKYERRTSL